MTSLGTCRLEGKGFGVRGSGELPCQFNLVRTACRAGVPASSRAVVRRTACEAMTGQGLQS